MCPDDWLLKIAAFLYDPPEKAIAHGKRASWGAEHFQTLTGSARTAPLLSSLAATLGAASLEDLLKQHVHPLAASSDRFSFGDKLGTATKGAMKVEFLKDPVTLHPLSARENPWTAEAARQLGQLADIDSDDPSRNPAFQAVARCLQAIKTNFPNDPRKQFLALWRLLPEWVPQANPAIPGLLWDHLPADTRTPDHTVRDAALAASAIMSAVPKPAFLLFSFGPIQPFIKTSRRTQDFWMGSLLLSWLSWQAIKAVAEKYGPDAILYPDLYRQPFVYRWLKEEAGLDVTGPFTIPWAASRADLATSSFPTRFLAILPKEGAGQVAQCACDGLDAEWKSIAGAVKTKVEALGINGFKASSFWEQLWTKQALTRSPFECRWVVLPWEGDGARGLETGRRWIALGEATIQLYETLKANLPAEKFFSTHTYGLLYDLLDRGHSSRRRLHAFGQMAEERGEKCTLCGERDALRPVEKISHQDLCEFWASVADKLPGHIAPEGEMLCAVCLTRRMASKFYDTFHRAMDLDYHFTSTSGIAAAPFQEAAMKKGLGDEAAAFTEALKNLPEQMFKQLPGEWNADPRQRQFRASPVPSISNQAQADPWKEFVQVDGEWLFEEAYERHFLKENLNLSEEEKSSVRNARQKLAALRSAAETKDTPPPCPYFAVLYFDGDEMGKWLRGEKAPLVGDILHPQSAKGLLSAAATGSTAAMASLPFYEALKGLRRPMGPALHRAISAALRNFALEITRTVVEEQHRGRLIYAGGDELLALLPLEDALPAARTLRQLWSGEAFGRDGLVSLAGFVGKANRVLTLMGGVTASAGLVYAHYLFPLSLVIEAAYKTVDDQAKETLGRDALGITILKRSGERIDTGARWRYGGLSTPDLLRNLANALNPQTGFLSRRMAYQLRELKGSIEEMEPKAQIALLEQQFDRHAGPAGKEKAKEVKAQLRGFLAELQAHQPGPAKPSVFARFLDLFFVAEFLAARGGRG